MSRLFPVCMLLGLLFAACGSGSSNGLATAAPSASASSSTGSGVRATSPAVAITSAAASAVVPAATRPATGSPVATLATGSAPTASTPKLGTPAALAPAPAGATTIVLLPDQSEARYRAREQLTGRNLPSDAAGTTSKLSGQVVLDKSGAIVQDASKIRVDLNSLQSDESRRDNYIKGNTLQTSKYPEAVFVPTQAQGLPWPLPASGQVSFQLTGDLTLHGVTKMKSWDVIVTFAGQTVTGNATTSLTFEEFGMSPPKVALVLSVEDSVRLEFDFTARTQD